MKKLPQKLFVTLENASNFIVDIGLSSTTVATKEYYHLAFTKKYKLKDLAESFIKVMGNKNSKIEVTGATS